MVLGRNKTKPEPEISPEELEKKKKAYIKAKAEYEEASGEKKKADAKKMRCGKYHSTRSARLPTSRCKLIQRRQHAYKEQLVTLAEKQLQFEIATISQLAIKYDKEHSKKMEEEVAAAEEKRKKSKSQKTPSEDSKKDEA